MEDPQPALNAEVPNARGDRVLTSVERATLMEAQARREAEAARLSAPLPAEQGGPRGPEPTRYGDWEKKGLAIDF